MIQEKKIDNFHVFKLFQNVKTRWNLTCYMLIKTSHLKKILQKYHDKHETNYLRLIDIEWSQMKYLINLIKLFCVFIKNIDQFKYFIIHQMFDIYEQIIWSSWSSSWQIIAKENCVKKDHAKRFNCDERKTSTILREDSRFIKSFIRKSDFVIFKQEKRDISEFKLKDFQWWNIVKWNVLICFRRTISWEIL
jgi:hypothetical protein